MTHSNEPAPARRLSADEGGAIMVMGIFMCLFLVGALWYIAGLGDVLLFRERMQEASDAVAMSTAMLEARGMNMIVMVNLLMAALEAILVALNLVIFAVLATAVVLAAIGAALSIFGGAGAPFLTAATDLGLIYKNALKPLHDNVVQPGVDKGLKILHGVWTKIVPAVPKAAQAASLEIAGFYESTVNELAAAALIFGSGGKPLLSLSLPVVDGSTHKLCMKAFDAIEGALDMPFQNTPLKDIGAIAIEPIKALINGLGASDQFCELGDSGSSDTSQALKQLGKNQCDSNQSIKDQCQKASDAQAKASRVAAACSGWSPDLNPPKPMPDPDCPNVQALQDTADSEQQLCDDGQKRCQDKTNDAANNVPKNATPGQGSSQGKEPAKVDDNWWNGTDAAQLLAVERGDGKSVTYSPKFVKVASQGRVEMADPSDLKGQTFSLSQAEFFYDKGGDWDTVNADEDAMWNFHWRARFRLVNPKVFGAQGVILDGVELELGAKIGSGVVTNPSLVPAKVTLARDVLNLTPPMSMVLH